MADRTLFLSYDEADANRVQIILNRIEEHFDYEVIHNVPITAQLLLTIDCHILITGEETHLNPECLKNIKLAEQHKKKGRFIIYLTDILDIYAAESPRGLDLYSHNNLYTTQPAPSGAYHIKSYTWIQDLGVRHLDEWVEDAIERATST